LALFDTREDIDHDVVLPPAWAFGILYGGYTSAAQTLDRLRQLGKAGIPIDAYWVDAWFWDRTGKGPRGYLNFEPDRQWFPDPEGFFAALDAMGVRAGVWVWDRILRDGNESVFKEFLDRGYFREVSVMREKWHSNGLCECGWVDFNNLRAARYWMEKLRPLFSMGLDFLKVDATPHFSYVKAAFEATQEFGIHTRGRGFVLAHTSSDGDPAMKRFPTVWTGDSRMAWDQPDHPDGHSWAKGGLRQQVEMVANPGHPNYQWPFISNDTGGFAHGIPSDELYMRWCQFSCFNPVTQLFGAPNVRGSNFPFEYGSEARENLRFFARLKLQFFPYIYSYVALTRLTGRKMIRGNGMHLDQYQFGDELIVAPVVEPGARERSVFLPRGTWIDFWTGEPHESPLGKTIIAKAPLDRIPLFVRSGAIIPMREEATSILEGSNDPLILAIYPEDKSLFYLIEDDGTSNDYLMDGFVRTTIQCSQTSSGSGNRQVRISLRSTGYHKGFRPMRTVYARLHGIRSVRDVDNARDVLLPVSSLEGLRAASVGYWVDDRGEQLWVKLRGNTVDGMEVTVEY
jgi:alpha-glucosidase (family GH31 glycosyl hydrolase)